MYTILSSSASVKLSWESLIALCHHVAVRGSRASFAVTCPSNRDTSSERPKGKLLTRSVWELGKADLLTEDWLTP